MKIEVRLLCAGILLLNFLSAAADGDMVRVRKNICDSYLRVLNDDPVLRGKISELGKHGENPDIMIRELQEGIDPEQAGTYLSSQQPDGSWADLNYRDPSRSGWKPSFHASRLVLLAKAYREPGGKYEGDKAVAAAVHRGMKFWADGNFRCRNWWYNEIGVPKMMGTVYLLMEEEMSPAEKAAAVKYMENARFGKTGQNSVWLAENVLVRALLQGNDTLFLQARKAILEELRINAKGEGIRPDLSFHQHGALLQFGNYGLAFANTMSYWARMFGDTRYALSGEQMKVLRDYMLGGMQWIVWRGYMDISSCARQLFRSSQEGKAWSVGRALRNMMEADTAHRAEYETFYVAHVLADGRTENTLRGNRYFPYSDFAVHRTDDWCATLKMSSSRVIGSEIVNDENLSGYYMGDGALYVYGRGGEYRDIYPVWDWTMVPGTTACDDPQVFAKNKGYAFRNSGDFVGGISDGKRGIAAMKLNKNGVTGLKSWFFVGDAVVCVGSGIRSSQPCLVRTTVEQNLKQGDVLRWEGKKGEQAFYHNGQVYLFPKAADVQMSEGVQEGSWRRVALFFDTLPVRSEVFRLWVNHRALSPEQSAGYYYVVMPGVERGRWKKRAGNNPVRLLAQDEQLHVVASDSVRQMVFFHPGAVRLESADEGLPGVFRSETPAVVQLVREPEGLRLSAADPTWKQESLRFRISGKWNGPYCYYSRHDRMTVVTLPVAGKEGNTGEIFLQKDR